MDTLAPLVQALLIVNPLLSVLVGASLWFGLGGKMGNIVATMNGNKELLEKQIEQLTKERAECQERELKRIEDHELRLRELKGLAHSHNERL